MKIFENKGEEAVTAEVDQLYKQNCFEMILFKYLTTYERLKACYPIILLTENNNGYVKRRSMLNGKQSLLWTTR